MDTSQSQQQRHSPLTEEESSSSSSSSSLQSDLESLVRVRTRLSKAPDSALPKILTGLLPKLLMRLERNHVLSLNSSSGSSSRSSSTSRSDTSKPLAHNPTDPCVPPISTMTTKTIAAKDQRMLIDKAQYQLTQILAHALERIQNGHHTIPHGAPWVDSLLPLLVCQDSCWESSVAATFLLAILQCSLTWYADFNHGRVVHQQEDDEDDEYEQEQSRQDILLVALPSLCRFVHTLHCKIQQEVRSNTLAPKSKTEISSFVPESLLLNYRKASWLCLDVLALSWGLPVLLDWDKDHFDEYAWSTPCCSTATEAFLEHGVSRRSQSSETKLFFLEESGSFQLWLDLLLFFPPENLPARNQRRVVRTADELLVENATGMAPAGIERMNYRCKKGQAWNLRYLRELKLACMHSVVDPLRLLPDAAASLEDLSENLPLLRSLVLCILTASPGSMHGKVAIKFTNKIGMRFAKKPGHAQMPSPDDPWSFGNTSLVLACTLLVLILGDDVASKALRKHAAGRKKIDEILGPWQGVSDSDNDSPKAFARAAMPVSVTEHCIDFILTRLVPIVNEKKERLASHQKRHKNDDGSNGMKTVPLLPVFVDLVDALSTSKGTFGSYWAIQCLSSIYSQVLYKDPPNNISTDNANIDAASDWRQTFQTTCLQVAFRVLSQIGEVDAETMMSLGELQRNDRRVQHQPGGVPGPFGTRRDLNAMLASHRTSQKKRQLRVDGALRARKEAYRIVTELAENGAATLELSKFDMTNNRKSSVVLDMPIVLLKCAAGEEESCMEPYVSKALQAWLGTYKDALHTNDLAWFQKQVAALLPSLLCAVCSASSVARFAAVKWVAELILSLDPGVAVHVCAFLVDDVDSNISGAAKKALKSVRESTPAVVGSPRRVQIDFLNLTNADDKLSIRQDLESRVQQTAVLLDIPISAAPVLLGDFDFDINAVLGKCANNKREALSSSGISSRCSSKDTVMMESGREDVHSTLTCGICYDDVGESEQHKLFCGHIFCLSCWHAYVCCVLDERPAVATAVLSIRCPEQDCNERVTSEDVAIIAPERLEQWDAVEEASFVKRSKDYSNCPGADCKAVAHLISMQDVSMQDSNVVHIPEARCNLCSTMFCFSCGSNPHEPAKCTDFAEWNCIFGSSQFWVKKNSKPCPSCSVPIEKNQGCNHIRCSLCQYDFCWLCLGHLRAHLEPHICNRYEAHESAENDEERRALFFTDRFKAHDDAEVFARTELKSFQEKLEKLSAESLWFASDEDLDSMLKGGRTLVKARNFLKNSYVAAWAMRTDLEHRDIFESHQANLELFTEKLSQLLLTKVHQLYAEQGARAIDMHFRAIVFSTTSLEQYMSRIINFIDQN